MKRALRGSHGIVDRQDDVDREVLGREDRLVDDADGHAALVDQGAAVQAGRRLEVDADLVAALRAHVRDHQKDPEEPEQSDNGKESDQRLPVHNLNRDRTDFAPLQELLHDRIDRVLDLLDGSIGDDGAFEQHRNVIRHQEDAGQVVGDDHRRAVRARPRS